MWIGWRIHFPTFPACCGQAFLPGGASRTVHSSLLLSGECWWASICGWQPGGGEPPNTPLIPHGSQGKGLDVQVQGFLLSACVGASVNSLFHTLFHCVFERNRPKHSNKLLMMTFGTRWISGWAWLLLSASAAKRKGLTSHTHLSGACSQIWGIKHPCTPGCFHTLRKKWKSKRCRSSFSVILMFSHPPLSGALIPWFLWHKEGGITFQTCPVIWACGPVLSDKKA